MLLLLIATALLWRIGSWQVSPAASLNMDEGLREGTEAPELAATSAGDDRHLSFIGQRTFLVFGSSNCAPCQRLLEFAPWHPATKPMRRVYVTGSLETDLPPDILAVWEAYRFHDDRATRERWRAPVVPFFHVIGENGRILAKGIASQPDHLDRLLGLAPPGFSGRALVAAGGHANGSELR